MASCIPPITRIESLRRQRTLKHRVDVTGFGFWSSLDVVYSFRPAPDNSGIRFFRSDLPDSTPIPALVDYRIKKPRQTSLANNGAQVDMIEHILAALHGARIDNCDVIVNNAEAPGMDGSGKAFLDAFLETGTVEQTSEKIRLKITAEGRFIDESKSNGGEIVFLPCGPGQSIYQYTLHYDVPSFIPNQTARFDFNRPAEEFRREIASCRTFLTLPEANYLREQGICSRVSVKDVLVFDQNGPIDNATIFENECARHKVLDMIGDFSLSPYDWEGEFRATKTGHQQNADALKMLLSKVTPEILK